MGLTIALATLGRYPPRFSLRNDVVQNIHMNLMAMSVLNRVVATYGDFRSEVRRRFRET